MPSAERSSINPVIMFWLARELEKEIPDLDLYGTDRKLLDFASKDLETWLDLKLENANSDEIEKALNVQDNPEEIKAFLTVWTKQWLEKWRERVTLCQNMPVFSLKHVKRKKRAKKILERMEDGQELKRWVVQKLVNQGEVCMPELIAENLVIEQIAYRMKTRKEKTAASKTAMEPWQILQDVTPQVNSLAKSKTPLIHMKLMIDANGY
ncbi:MAG TPA: hypothetical protein ENN36_07110 [Candidatus Bathyarchaeota archaeon]|nr:hypothetical protein [Candidatus Bathyarchaeota archaeon]